MISAMSVDQPVDLSLKIKHSSDIRPLISDVTDKRFKTNLINNGEIYENIGGVDITKAGLLKKGDLMGKLNNEQHIVTAQQQQQQLLLLLNYIFSSSSSLPPSSSTMLPATLDLQQFDAIMNLISEENKLLIKALFENKNAININNINGNNNNNNLINNNNKINNNNNIQNKNMLPYLNTSVLTSGNNFVYNINDINNINNNKNNNNNNKNNNDNNNKNNNNNNDLNKNKNKFLDAVDNHFKKSLMMKKHQDNTKPSSQLNNNTTTTNDKSDNTLNYNNNNNINNNNVNNKNNNSNNNINNINNDTNTESIKNKEEIVITDNLTSNTQLLLKLHTHLMTDPYRKTHVSSPIQQYNAFNPSYNTTKNEENERNIRELTEKYLNKHLVQINSNNSLASTSSLMNEQKNIASIVGVQSEPIKKETQLSKAEGFNSSVEEKRNDVSKSISQHLHISQLKKHNLDESQSNSPPKKMKLLSQYDQKIDQQKLKQHHISQPLQIINTMKLQQNNLTPFQLPIAQLHNNPLQLHSTPLQLKNTSLQLHNTPLQPQNAPRIQYLEGSRSQFSPLHKNNHLSTQQQQLLLLKQHNIEKNKKTKFSNGKDPYGNDLHIRNFDKNQPNTLNNTEKTTGLTDYKSTFVNYANNIENKILFAETNKDSNTASHIPQSIKTSPSNMSNQSNVSNQTPANQQLPYQSLYNQLSQNHFSQKSYILTNTPLFGNQPTVLSTNHSISNLLNNLPSSGHILYSTAPYIEAYNNKPTIKTGEYSQNSITTSLSDPPHPILHPIPPSLPIPHHLPTPSPPTLYPSPPYHCNYSNGDDVYAKNNINNNNENNNKNKNNNNLKIGSTVKFKKAWLKRYDEDNNNNKNNNNNNKNNNGGSDSNDSNYSNHTCMNHQHVLNPNERMNNNNNNNNNKNNNNNNNNKNKSTFKDDDDEDEYLNKRVLRPRKKRRRFNRR